MTKAREYEEDDGWGDPEQTAKDIYDLGHPKKIIPLTSTGMAEEPQDEDNKAEEYDDDEDEEREFDEDKELAEQDHMDKWSQKWFGEEESSISVAGPPADSTIPANSLYVDDEDEEAESIENILNEADFKEEDHPRDKGKFTSKGGGDSGGKHADKSEKDMIGFIKNKIKSGTPSSNMQDHLRKEYPNTSEDQMRVAINKSYDEIQGKKSDIPKAEPKKQPTSSKTHKLTGEPMQDLKTLSMFTQGDTADIDSLTKKQRLKIHQLMSKEKGYGVNGSNENEMKEFWNGLSPQERIDFGMYPEEKAQKNWDELTGYVSTRDNKGVQKGGLADKGMLGMMVNKTNDPTMSDYWNKIWTDKGKPDYSGLESIATERDFYTSNKQIDDQAWEIMAQEEFGKSVSELNDAQYDWIDQIMHDYGNNLDYSKKPSSEGGPGSGRKPEGGGSAWKLKKNQLLIKPKNLNDTHGYGVWGDAPTHVLAKWMEDQKDNPEQADNYKEVKKELESRGESYKHIAKILGEGIEEENLDDAEMWIGAYDTMGMSVEDINNKLKGMAIPNDTINKAWDNYKLNPTKNRNFESKANENEGWWECENCSAIAIKDEDKTEHEQDTGHTMYHAGFKPVVPLFHESKASEATEKTMEQYWNSLTPDKRFWILQDLGYGADIPREEMEEMSRKSFAKLNDFNLQNMKPSDLPTYNESRASESVTSWWGGRGQSSLEFRSKVLAKAGVYEGFQDKEFWEMPEYAQDKVYELYAGGYVGEAKLKSGYIQCPDCDQQFSNLQYLSDHMDERHEATEVSKKEWESASTKEKETMLEDVGFGMMSRPEGEVNSLALKKWEDLPRETRSMWGYYESYASEVEHDKCPHCNFETSWKEDDLWQHNDAKKEMYYHLKAKHGESYAGEAHYEVTIQGMDGGYFKTIVDSPDEDYAVYQARNQALTEKGEGYYDDTISFVKGVIRVGESHSDEQEVDLLTQLLDNELEEEEQGHDETEDIALITQLLAPESYSTKKKLSEFEDSNRPVSPNSLMRYTEPIDLPTGKNALDQTYGVSEPETPDGQDLTGVTLGEELTDEEFKKFRLKQQRHDYDLMTDKELEDEDKIFRQMSGDEEIIEKKFTPPKIHFYKQYPFGRRAGKQNPFGEATEQVRLSTMDRAHTWWDRKHPDRPWRDMRIGGRQRAIMAFLNDPDTTVAESYAKEDTVSTDSTNICKYCKDYIPDPDDMIKHIKEEHGEANEGGQGSGKNKEPHHIGWKNYGIDDYIEKAEKEYEEKSEEGKWDYVEGDNGEQEYGDNLERARIRMDAEKELLDKTEHARFPVKGGMDYQEGEERVIDEPRENMGKNELDDWQQRRYKEYEQDQKASDYLEKIKYSIDKGGAQFQRGGEDFGEWDNDESPMSALDKEKYELEGARHDMQMQKNFRNPNEMDKEETGFDWQKGGEQLEDPTPWASLAQLAGTTVKDILFPSEEQAGGGGAGGAGAGGTGATGGNGTGATGNGGEPPTNGNGEDEEQPSRRIGFFGYGRRRKCPEGKVYRNGKCVEAGEEKSFSDMTEEEMEELGDAESSPHTKEDVAEEGNDWIEDDLPNYIKELRNDLRKEGMLISEDDIITNIERKYNINRSIATDYLLDYYKKGNEGGKGSGKKDHKQWMIAIEEDHTYDFCENCSMITEQVNHKCAMCGKKVE